MTKLIDQLTATLKILLMARNGEVKAAHKTVNLMLKQQKPSLRLLLTK